MFSPEATVQSVRSLQRNPRRRPRKDSDGPQQPRRKRSRITEDAFKSPINTHGKGNENGSANGSVITNGQNGHVGHVEAENSLVIVDLPVRDKKPVVKRAHRDDAAEYLTRSDEYVVKRLPSFPEALSSGAHPFRASALPSAGLALALTSTRALAWDYTSITAPAKILSLPLPFNLKPSDPLPLGAVVRNGPTNDFGILAVAPSNGKITFWENVDSAEARSHFPQRHQGVDGSLKLYSGETITHLVDIDHAGYILVLSTGRLFHLILRDSQGRPCITTSVLSTPSISNGSFFSFKGLLGTTTTRSIVAVKARPSETKGQMEVISASRNGIFQKWDLSWSGQQIFKNEVDAHVEILSAIQSGSPPESREQQEIHILDFTMLGSSTHHDPGLLVLVALTGNNHIEYSLLELNLSDTTSPAITRAIPIRNFQQSQIPTEPAGTLLVPRPGHTAFVQFSDAIVIASLAEPEESPDAQLLSDSGAPTLPFQDTVYFRHDMDTEIAGSAAEDSGKRDKHSSIVLFIQGYGMLQLAAQPPSSNNSRVTARSKLEQATFFSIIPDNILDFSIKSRYTFSQEEVETAAIEISSEVLSSSLEYFAKFTTSIDEQMRKRAFALHTLIKQIQSDYQPISFATRWNLLIDAEKLASALAIWNDYQESMKEYQAHPEAFPEGLLLPFLVRCIHEDLKTVIQPELGETDPLRQWFLRDVSRIQVLVPWGWHILRKFYLGEEHDKERHEVTQRVSEGAQLTLTALETAFQFREENAELYGLDPDSFVDGVLKPGKGYDMLEEDIWTSTHNIVTSTRSLVDIQRIAARESFEQGVHEDLAMKMAKENPRLVKICCQVHIERFQWALEQREEPKRIMGQNVKNEWNMNVRPAHIYGLVDIGLATEGMNIAEHYRDMTTLVRLIWDESRYMEEHKATAQSKMEQAECAIKLNRIKERIQRYFSTYGEEWAEAFYKQYITQGRSGQIFHKEHLNQPALSKFLRAQPNRARLSWINEVCGEKRFDNAYEILYEAGMSQESNAWCKKVELSLAKLALLSTKEAKRGGSEEPPFTPSQAFKFLQVSKCLDYSNVQEELYSRLQPIISESLDDESAVRLLMTEFGQGRLTERPAHQQLLQQGFEYLVQHRVLEPALLIDVLTLMTSANPSEESLLALKALGAAWDELGKQTRSDLKRLIWKRVCIRDDWEQVGKTKDLSDEEVHESLVSTHAGLVFGALLKLIHGEPNYGTVWPVPFDVVLGAGCTDGELCVRFPSEDLRRPFIHDNVMDDQILQTDLEHHNLNQWFMNVCAAATEVHEALYPSAQEEGGETAEYSGDMDEDMDEDIEEVVEEILDIQQSVEEDYRETS